MDCTALKSTFFQYFLLSDVEMCPKSLCPCPAPLPASTELFCPTHTCPSSPTGGCLTCPGPLKCTARPPPPPPGNHIANNFPLSFPTLFFLLRFTHCRSLLITEVSLHCVTSHLSCTFF